MLCRMRKIREQHAYQEQAMIDSLQQQRAAAFSCRRLTWTEVKSPRTSPRSFTKECPSCHKQMLLHSLQYHLPRCKGPSDDTKNDGKSPSTSTPLASPRETNSSLASPQSLSTPRRPVSPASCTQRCSHCGCQVLRSSAAQHEARCKQRASLAAEGYPKRSVKSAPGCHSPSPTEPCPSCHRQIACHGLQSHYQRCRKWTEILEEKTRPTLLQNDRGKTKKSDLSQSRDSSDLGEAPLKCAPSCFFINKGVSLHGTCAAHASAGWPRLLDWLVAVASGGCRCHAKPG